MRQAIEYRAGQALAAEYLDPLAERQVGGHDHALPLVGRADHVEQQLGAEQAILQVLDAAKHRITLVSFAVHRIRNVGKALVRAAQRGVRLTVIVETPDKIEGEGEYSTIRALGQEVAACSTVFYWPKENREVGANNTPGILGVKCAVADAEWLLLSSANLTQQASTINTELGMLVRGGTMAKRVEQQFDALIQNGALRPV